MALTVSVVVGPVGGCILGPAALQVSRVRYNEVLRKTTDQQLLLNLVRLQYREAPSFLEVGSVSVQFTFAESANVAGTIIEGPASINPDRLDLGVGVVFEERPTITFTPLQGKDFANELLSPLQPDVIVLLSRSGWSIDRVLRLTVQAMNGLDNASSASGPTPDRAPQYRQFARLSRLFRALQRNGLLELVYEFRETELSSPMLADRVNLPDVINAVSKGYRLRPTKDGEDLVLTSSSQVLVWRIPPEAAGSPEVREIIELLGLLPGQSRYEIRVGALSEFLAVKAGERTQINILMRSLMGTLFYLSQAIEVPQRHRRKGFVTNTLDAQGQPFDWTLVTGDLLRVHSDSGRPNNAAVAARHRGYWYYIDDADLSSKSTFGLLSQLFALQAGGVESVTPVLTLPIGR